jgi:hypothetical protein
VRETTVDGKENDESEEDGGQWSRDCFLYCFLSCSLGLYYYFTTTLYRVFIL